MSHQPIVPGDFTSQADAYARARPGYPPVLVSRLIHEAGLRPGDVVADIGAGTGIFTRQLAQAGLAIQAVEPNPVMRAQAGDIPNVKWHEGSFEQTGLATGSIAWITAAQAFHWAKLPDALHEMARILIPRGRITLLWNRRLHENHPVTRWTIEAIHRHVPAYQEIYQGVDWTEPLTSTGAFGEVTMLEEQHLQPMSSQRYLDLWRSHNHLATVAGPDKLAAFLGELEAYLVKEHIRRIDVPYVCQAWSAVRVG